jgi:hypothetical protein
MGFIHIRDERFSSFNPQHPHCLWGINLTIHLHLVLDQACMKLHLHSPPYILISQRDNFTIFFFTSSVQVGAHVTWPAARASSRHTPSRVSLVNFNTIHLISFCFQNPIVRLPDAMFFIADLITYTATPPD